jgi:hypothetical protein
MAHKVILLKIINFIRLSYINKTILVLLPLKLTTLKKLVFANILVLLLTIKSTAQYYYKDIISSNQIKADLQAYKDNKIKKITIKSFEENGEESEGFFCEKKLNKKYTESTIFTRSNFSYASELQTKYDEAGRILSTYDSSAFSVTAIRYGYNDKNLITQIHSSIKSNAEEFNNAIVEQHFYTYENEIPINLKVVKNNRDTINILFETDEQGNITIEKNTANGTKYYYYYDDKNRLTDIVPATEYSKSLKPDYIFTYNNAGLITQMTAVEEGSSNYFVWKYTYDNGLRVREKCYSNERRLMGSIEYSYN